MNIARQLYPTDDQLEAWCLLHRAVRTIKARTGPRSYLVLAGALLLGFTQSAVTLVALLVGILACEPGNGLSLTDPRLWVEIATHLHTAPSLIGFYLHVTVVILCSHVATLLLQLVAGASVWLFFVWALNLGLLALTTGPLAWVVARMAG